MQPLSLHAYHEARQARFGVLDGFEVVADYARPELEYAALHESAGVLDLGFRGRLCLVGADRVRFMHGQVTNDVKALRDGQGCYAALVSAKGKMQADLNIYALPGELLLDFEPGLTKAITDRLEKYIVADDVQVVDVAAMYGLLSVQGPRSAAAVEAFVRERGADAPTGDPSPPDRPNEIRAVTLSDIGETYVAHQPRAGTAGFDLFVPATGMEAALTGLVDSAQALGGRLCGWEALDLARVEAGIPRFGADMDAGVFPHECGIESRAVSYRKGCYIGQEVLNRIHTIGRVQRELAGIRFPSADVAQVGARGRILREGEEIGRVTSVKDSPRLRSGLGLGIVRRDACQTGAAVEIEGGIAAEITSLPFARAAS